MAASSSDDAGIGRMEAVRTYSRVRALSADCTIPSLGMQLNAGPWHLHWHYSKLNSALSLLGRITQIPSNQLCT